MPKLSGYIPNSDFTSVVGVGASSPAGNITINKIDTRTRICVTALGFNFANTAVTAGNPTWAVSLNDSAPVTYLVLYMGTAIIADRTQLIFTADDPVILSLGANLVLNYGSLPASLGSGAVWVKGYQILA